MEFVSTKDLSVTVAWDPPWEQNSYNLEFRW